MQNISHKNLLKVYEKSSISVVNPTWEEPFGRTALESASRGCAVITSHSGGLSETFENNLILKKLIPNHPLTFSIHLRLNLVQINPNQPIKIITTKKLRTVNKLTTSFK